MTEEEYKKQYSEIIKKYGEPIYELGAPDNNSASKLVALKIQKANEAREIKRLGGTEGSASGAKLPGGAGPLKDFVENEINKLAACVPDPDLKETDLQHFDDEEKQVIRLYFSDLRQTAKEMGERLGLSRQKVAHVMHSDRFKALYNRVFKSLLPLEALIAIRANLKRNDAKVALEVLRDAGILKSESVDLNVNHNKPIEDSKASQLLKNIGDSIAKGEVIIDIPSDSSSKP